MNEEIEYQLQPILTPHSSQLFLQTLFNLLTCSCGRDRNDYRHSFDINSVTTVQSERERSAPKMVQKSKCDIITESVTFEPQQILYLEAFFILGYHWFSIFESVKSFRWSGYKCVRCTNSHWSWWKRHVLSLCFSSFTPLPFPDSAFDSSSSSALISSSPVSFACLLLAFSPPPPLPSIFFFYFPSAQISIICLCRREDKSSSRSVTRVCADLPLLYKEIKTCCVSVLCLDVYIDLFVYK